MAAVAPPDPIVTDEHVVHGVLMLLGLARVAAALVRPEAWGAGPTLGLVLAVWACHGLFRAGKS